MERPTDLADQELFFLDVVEDGKSRSVAAEERTSIAAIGQKGLALVVAIEKTLCPFDGAE